MSWLICHEWWKRGFIYFFKTKGQNLQHRSTVLQEDLSFSITIIFHDFLYKKEFNSIFWFRICYELKKCMLHFCSHFQLIIYTFIWPSHIWNIHFFFSNYAQQIEGQSFKKPLHFTLNYLYEHCTIQEDTIKTSSNNLSHTELTFHFKKSWKPMKRRDSLPYYWLLIYLRLHDQGT